MTSSTEGDNRLAARLQGGDRDALAELFSGHRERFRRVIGFRMDRQLSGRIDPDDVLQDAYLAASQRLAHFPGDGSLSPFVWLRMIVMQTLVDMHRRHLGTQMRDADREVAIRGIGGPQTTSASMAALLMGKFTSPSQAATRAERFEQLRAAIAAMDTLDQEVLALRHFEELSNSEVAEVLGIQQKAASIRYVRALGRLKAVLSRWPGFGEG